MYPSSIPDVLSNRARVDNESASFFAGTQARTFREISLAAGASLYVRMLRPVDIVIRRFNLQVNEGELRCDIYRGATPAGVWSESLTVFAANEMSARPEPAYVPKSSIEAGGTFSGGELYDIIYVKTGTNNQRSTVGNSSADILGAPAGTGWYKFSNPGTGTSVGIFTLRWEELPPT